MSDWQVRSDASDAIDRLLAPLDRPGEPGGIVAIVRENRTIHLAGYGLGNVEAGWRWSPDTAYDIASLTKTLVAQAVVRLVDEGTLDLDADLRELVPSLDGVPRPVTVRDAMSMRSGFRADEELAWMAGRNGWVDEPHLHALISRQRSLQFEPGTWQIYSDSNYRLLARVMVSVLRTPFADAMRALVFDPLGLDATSIVPYDWNVSPALATYYQRSDDGWLRRPYGYESSGDGAVRTSLRDTLRWLRLTLHADHAGVPAIGRLARDGDTVPSMPYRFGVFVDTFRGLERWQHTGASGTAYVHYPEPDLTIVAFHNRDDLPPWRLIDDLTDAVLDSRGYDPRRNEASDRVPWAPGCWVDPSTGYHALVSGDGTVRVLGNRSLVRAEDGRLTAHFRLEAPSPLAVGDHGELLVDLGEGPMALQIREQASAPEDVAGTYRSSELDASIALEAADGTSQLVLGAGHNPGLRVPLSWYGDDFAVGGNLGLGAERVEGEVAAIVLSTWGARRVRFTRVDGPGP